MATVLRQRKDGGVSKCSAPDHLVGKGRCCHVLSDADTVQFTYDKEQRCYFVDVGEAKSEKTTIKAKSEEIKSFFDKLEDSLPREEKEKLISSLREIR